MKRYDGRGVLKAVSNTNDVIGPKMKGMDALAQRILDKTLNDLDGTPNKDKLGANSILSVSMAAAVAASHHVKLPLYQYLHSLVNGGKSLAMTRIPTPIFNMVNGGKHGGGNLDFQEYHIIPATNRSFHEALRMGSELYHAVLKLLVNRGQCTQQAMKAGLLPIFPQIWIS